MQLGDEVPFRDLRIGQAFTYVGQHRLDRRYYVKTGKRSSVTTQNRTRSVHLLTRGVVRYEGDPIRQFHDQTKYGRTSDVDLIAEGLGGLVAWRARPADERRAAIDRLMGDSTGEATT